MTPTVAPPFTNPLHPRPKMSRSGRPRVARITTSAASSVMDGLNSILDATPDYLLRSSPTTFAVETTVAAVLAGGAAIWTRRPLGSSCETIEVRESSIHGRGVFATASIPAGARLGVYPGVPRSPQEMVAKAAYAPAAKDYCFVSEAGVVLDPTDDFGNLTERPYSLWPLSVDTTLA